MGVRRWPTSWPSTRIVLASGLDDDRRYVYHPALLRGSIKDGLVDGLECIKVLGVGIDDHRYLLDFLSLSKGTVEDDGGSLKPGAMRCIRVG